MLGVVVGEDSLLWRVSSQVHNQFCPFTSFLLPLEESDLIFLVGVTERGFRALSIQQKIRFEIS